MENISNTIQNQKRNQNPMGSSPEKQLEEDKCLLLFPSENFDEKDNSNEETRGNNQNGRWNKEEHMLFLKGCLLYENNWKKVQKYVKTRSSSQIRSHAQKYLIKLSKKHQAVSSKPMIAPNYNECGFKQMSNEELDRFIDNMSETSNEMNLIEEYILAIFQPELKLQEALNVASMNQRRGRKTEPKKKQKIFQLEKCMNIRNQQKNKKNDELISYLNSNDPNDLSKLMLIAEKSDINDLLQKNSSSLSSSYLNTTPINDNSFTLPKKELVFDMFWSNQPSMSTQPIANPFPLINTIDDGNRINAFPYMFNHYPFPLPQNKDMLYSMLSMNNYGMGTFNHPGFY